MNEKEKIYRLIESGRLAELVCEAVTGKRISNSKDAWNFLKPFFAAKKDKTVERFVGLFLDQKGRAIELKELAVGTLDSAPVPPREVIKAALGLGAASVIFAHNHPSGDHDPSQQDRVITCKLLFACHVVGVTVADHLVVGGAGYFSFSDEGLIDIYRRKAENTINEVAK